MVSDKQRIRTICLLSAFLAGLAYLVFSFHPVLRFADPSPKESPAIRTSFHCFYDKIYGPLPGSDVLYFGASKTRHAVDAKAIGQVYESVTGEGLDTFAFDVSGSNPAIVYSFFRDYLAHKPAPEMAFFELTENVPNFPPVRYMHFFFPDLAPPYLYLDILRSWDVVNHKLFAVSDFLRLFIRHIDLSLSRLLVADLHFTVPPGDNCSHRAQHGPGFSIGDSGRYSFAQLLDAEMERQLPPFDRDDVGGPSALLETYADTPHMRRNITKMSKKWAEGIERPFWRDRKQLKQRSLYYYRRIAATGKAHGVRVAFYYLPLLLAPKPREANIRKLSDSLGAEVYILPYRYARISYHNYNDVAHVKPVMRPAFAIWFASLIDRSGKG